MRRKQQNSGFSLIELIIALAVLAFLMLAVSSFMGSSVMQSKKARADVKMQTQSQEVYNLITDSIMQREVPSKKPWEYRPKPESISAANPR